MSCDQRFSEVPGPSESVTFCDPYASRVALPKVRFLPTGLVVRTLTFLNSQKSAKTGLRLRSGTVGPEISSHPYFDPKNAAFSAIR